jgi:hypothetical protein
MAVNLTWLEQGTIQTTNRLANTMKSATILLRFRKQPEIHQNKGTSQVMHRIFIETIIGRNMEG